MSQEGFDDRRKEGEERAQARNLAEIDHTLEGPGSEERLRALQARFRAAREAEARMPGYQLVLIGIFVFLVILIFGAGRFVVADLAPKPPPGLDLNAIAPAQH
jgi:hypothetical protein